MRDMPIRIGAIDAGEYSEPELRLYRALYPAHLPLQAVCDVSRESKASGRVREIARLFNSRYYTTPQEMFKNEALDAVIVCMKAQTRGKFVLETLAAGYHVFLPKPPATSLEEVLTLAEAAEQHNKILMVNCRCRFSKGVKEAMRLMKKPSFGPLTQVLGSVSSDEYPSMEAFLLESGLHYLDLASYIAGAEPEEIAVFHNAIYGCDAFAISMKYTNGAIGNLQMTSHRLWQRDYDYLEITGHREYIQLEHGLQSVRHFTADGNTFTSNHSDEQSSILNGTQPALIEFVSAIREHREPIASIRDCIGTMRFYEAVLRAVREKQPGVSIALDPA